MKQYILYTIAFFTIALFSTSCSDEDRLTPSDIDNMSRFEFPEGDSEVDHIFTEIDEKYGVKIIYKGWKEKDWDKSWTNPGSGAITNIKIGRYFESGEVDSTLIAAEFIRDNIFAHIGPNLFKKHKPYIYLVNSYADLQSAGTVTYGSYVLYNTLVEGLDYVIWSPYNTPSTNPLIANSGNTELFNTDSLEAKHVTRARIIYNRIILPRINDNTIVEPSNYRNLLDSKTLLNLSDKNDKDYYLNRGFVDIPNSIFASVSKPKSDPSQYVDKNGIANLFPVYIRLAMYYDEATVNEIYKDYPLVIELYNKTVEHMFSKYDVDLRGIAEKY